MKKNRILLIVTLIVALLPIAVILNISYLRATAPPVQFSIFYPDWLTNPRNEVSASQLGAAYAANGLRLELPTRLPNGLLLTSVHVPNVTAPYGFAMVTYSAKGITDFKNAEVVFQIIPGGQPSPSELSAMVGNSQGTMTQQTVAGMAVLINPQAGTGDKTLQQQYGSGPYAMFWNNGVYYQVREYSPLTANDLIAIIASMQPVATNGSG
jgi:hypothetical protein